MMKDCVIIKVRDILGRLIRLRFRLIKGLLSRLEVKVLSFSGILLMMS